MPARDVIIVGAPRSGTNMLRDVLTTLPGVVTWPCDEINAVWRHGSADYPSDEIPPERATARMQRFVQSRFDAIRRRQRGQTVVEKTCANSLRVDYVAALLPSARFVLITRDGVDATASALARWDAPVDWRYTARKARHVPAGDLAAAATRFGQQRLRRRASSPGTAHSWGPRFAGIDELLQAASLEEVAATQWQRCVELSRTALDRLPAEQVYRVGYEDFVRQPEPSLAGLLKFLQLPADGAAQAVAPVTAGSVGKARTSLSAAQLARVEQVLTPTLMRMGYV